VICSRIIVTVWILVFFSLLFFWVLANPAVGSDNSGMDPAT
jgi:hypothetical protein